MVVNVLWSNCILLLPACRNAHEDGERIVIIVRSQGHHIRSQYWTVRVEQAVQLVSSQLENQWGLHQANVDSLPGNAFPGQLSSVPPTVLTHAAQQNTGTFLGYG